LLIRQNAEFAELAEHGEHQMYLTDSAVFADSAVSAFCRYCAPSVICELRLVTCDL
jgi:hypothetical protein